MTITVRSPSTTVHSDTIAFDIIDFTLFQDLVAQLNKLSYMT
jgi:hypothetical protein